MKMELFDVYSLWNIEPVKAKGCHVWDNEGNEYLDLYGGHAVISIGHSHPVYIKAISDQVEKIGFYSNSVLNSLQKTLAQKLGEQSGYTDYSLFLCNSGAEANENALKLASFYTGKSRVIAFKEAFHGRTSGAVAITDNPDIQSPFNSGHEVTFSTLNDIASVEAELNKGDVAAVIIEGIQGVAGIFVPEAEFLQQLDQLCKKHNVPLILDEIQSGYGRSGKFFAMYLAYKTASEYALSGNGPMLIEAFTYRLGAHTTSDDPSKYRKKEEEEKWALVDPLLRLERYMKKMNIWNIDKDKLKEEYKQEIDAQFVSAENEKAYKIGDVFDYMYTDMPEDLMRQKDAYEQYLSWKENRK
jgi:hypothetical protein